MSDDKILELKDAMLRMEHTLKTFGEKQDEILADVRVVKNAVYDPEKGLYARVNNVEAWRVGMNDYPQVKEDVRDIKVWKATVEDYPQVKEEVRDIRVWKQSMTGYHETKADVRDLKTWQSQLSDYEDIKDDVRDLNKWSAGITKALWAAALPLAGLLLDKVFHML